MADYINEDSLTDKKAIHYKTDDPTFWASIVADADSAVVDLAQALGLDESKIETPLHTGVNDYARFYFYSRLFLELSGVNEADTDGYKEKGADYYGLMLEQKQQITPEMITKTVNGRGDRVQEGILFHT